MTLADFGTIAEIVSAIAVMATLVYLARQVGHANKLAQMQTRQQMVEHATDELRLIIDDPEMATRLSKPAPLDFADAMKVYHALTLALRQREWEWYQAHNGAIGKQDADQVKRDCLEVASLWLGYRRARQWWNSSGRFGLNPEFVAELDRYLEGRPLSRYDLDLMALETAMVEEDKRLAQGASNAQILPGESE